MMAEEAKLRGRQWQGQIMRKQAIAIAFTVATTSFLVLLLCIAALLFSVHENRYNPYHKGKRVRDWADTAIWDSDPAKRREAAQALAEAYHEMEPGEPRVQLTMLLCYPRTNKPELPKEVLPFLLVVLHAKDMPPGGYQSQALSQVEPDAAVPVLVEVALKDEDSDVHKGARYALYSMAQRGVPKLKQVLAEGDENERKLVGDIFQEIESLNTAVKRR